MTSGRRGFAVVVVLCALTVAACSSSSSSAAPAAPNPDLTHEPNPPEPEVFATGIVAWGAGDDEQFRYEIEEVLGFAHSVTIRADGDDRHSVRSANRQGGDDAVWLAIMVFSDDAPAIVFGGVDTNVESLVLRNRNAEDSDVVDEDDESEGLMVTPIQLPDRDWSLVTVELPQSWSTEGSLNVEAVARSETAPISTDRLSS